MVLWKYESVGDLRYGSKKWEHSGVELDQIVTNMLGGTGFKQTVKLRIEVEPIPTTYVAADNTVGGPEV
jgi:hypothetical protein